MAQDEAFILNLLMLVIQQVDKDLTQKIMIFLSKFGQKQQSSIELTSLINRQGVESITYHTACTLSGKDPRVDLMWSRFGLQEVVGHRGSLYTPTGIPEAANLKLRPPTPYCWHLNPQHLPRASTLLRNHVLEDICYQTACPHAHSKSMGQRKLIESSHLGQLCHAYNVPAYLRACEELGRPARTFRAFMSKKQQENLF